MDKVTKKAYGKVNLFLSVGALRPDGRHDVENVMCRVGIYDTVIIEKLEKGIILGVGDSKLPITEDNLAYRAAKLYIERFNINSGVKISIEKRIPIKAGMAGGSTDGAAVLLAMNELFGKATLDQLVAIACTMGADVPFFLYETPVMLGRGTGTELSPLPAVKNEMYGLFVTHGEKQSTGAMFSLLDRTRESTFEQKKAEQLIKALECGDADAVLAEMYNDFELCTEHFAKIKDALIQAGAKKVLLSGSGPTVFGVYGCDEDARNAACVIPYPSFVCRIGI